MPPVTSPPTSTSATSASFTGSRRRPGPPSAPGRLRRDGGAGGDGLRPDQLELALLPLADHARRRDVFALGELDRAGDRLELGGVEHRLDLRAVEADLGHAPLEDLERRVGERARPPVGLLLVLLDVRVVVLARAGELHLGVPARDPHHALRALEAVAV